MNLFGTFHRGVRAVLGCVALSLATACAAAMPLPSVTANNISADRAWVDPGAQVYVELLNMQDKAIDQAAVAVEAAHEQNTRLAFVLSVLVAVMGSACAWLALAALRNRAADFVSPKTSAANRSGNVVPIRSAG